MTKTMVLEGRPSWIEWAGGDIPVRIDALVELTFRNPGVPPMVADAIDVCWEHSGLPQDVVAYRVLPPDTTYDDLRREAQSALNVQEGGSHYKEMKIQPVEFIHANGIPFIEGSIIKYVSRWRKKNGVEDLKKARHFMDLLIELEEKSGNGKTD